MIKQLAYFPHTMQCACIDLKIDLVSKQYMLIYIQECTEKKIYDMYDNIPKYILVGGII